jgi:hypothetical protein
MKRLPISFLLVVGACTPTAGDHRDTDTPDTDDPSGTDVDAGPETDTDAGPETDTDADPVVETDTDPVADTDTDTVVETDTDTVVETDTDLAVDTDPETYVWVLDTDTDTDWEASIDVRFRVREPGESCFRIESIPRDADLYAPENDTCFPGVGWRAARNVKTGQCWVRPIHCSSVVLDRELETCFPRTCDCRADVFLAQGLCPGVVPEDTGVSPVP